MGPEVIVGKDGCPKECNTPEEDKADSREVHWVGRVTEIALYMRLGAYLKLLTT